MVGAFGVQPEDVRETMTGMIVAMQQGMRQAQVRNAGYSSCEIDLGEGLRVEFRSREDIALFGTPAQIGLQFAQEIAKFAQQFDEVPGADQIGTNQHQITLQFSGAPIQAIISTSKPRSNYGTTQSFLQIVSEGLIEQTRHETSEAEIDQMATPYAGTPWGKPEVIPTTGRTSRAHAHQPA